MSSNDATPAMAKAKSPTRDRDPAGESDPFLWDVFLSHSGSQKPLVRAIVHQWRELGLRVFFDEDTIEPGSDINEALDCGCENSRHVVLMITRESMTSEWVASEIQRARHLDPAARRRRLKPVLLESVPEAEIPSGVARLSWTNLADDATRQQQYQSLLKSLRVKADPLPDFPVVETEGVGSAALVQNKPELETGAMPTESHFYIERSVERSILGLLENPGVTVTVRGYRQSGKRSLLARLHAHAVDGPGSSCIVDFQGLAPRTFEDAEAFFPALAHSIATELALEVDPVSLWDPRMDEAQNLTMFVEKQVLGALDGPVLFLFDEADRTFRYPAVCDALFSTLRSWHNRRANKRKSGWKRLGMVVAHSTEPALWLKDLNQSPFKNVARQFLLDDLDEAEVTELDARYGHQLQEGEVEGLMKLIGGHPYLVRLALYTMATEPCSFAALKGSATEEHGPFASHLAHFLNIFSSDKQLLTSIRKILKHGKCEDELLFQRLWSVGLIRGADRRRVSLRYAIYDEYFRKTIL
jgi:AAA-like domain/TIR domain